MIRNIIRDHGNLVAIHDDGSREYFFAGTGGVWVNRVSDPANPVIPGTNPVQESIVYVTPEMITAAVTALGGSVNSMTETPQSIAQFFNEAINKVAPSSFLTKARVACLIGECAYETDSFKTYKEYGGENASYAPYYGRGMIQLTWKDNYYSFGQWLSKYFSITNDIFVHNPDLVASQPYSTYTAIFYLTQTWFAGQPLINYADVALNQSGVGDWYQVSRAINRGSIFATEPAYGEAQRNNAINAVLAVTPSPVLEESPSIRQNAVNYGLSVLGRFYYSQDKWVREHMLTSGGGDCSSFVVLCYTEGAGLETYEMGGYGTYPGYTGTLANAGTFINDTGDTSNMLPGDWMCLTYEGFNEHYDHVVLYIGGDQCLSHGSGMGPNVESFSWYVNNSSHRVVRGFR